MNRAGASHCIYLFQDRSTNIPDRGSQDISMFCESGVIGTISEKGRAPVVGNFVVRVGLDKRDGMVLHVEPAKETSWLTAGDVLIVLPESQILVVEVVDKLYLAMDDWLQGIFSTGVFG